MRPGLGVAHSNQLAQHGYSSPGKIIELLLKIEHLATCKSRVAAGHFHFQAWKLLSNKIFNILKRTKPFADFNRCDKKCQLSGLRPLMKALLIILTKLWFIESRQCNGKWNNLKMQPRKVMIWKPCEAPSLETSLEPHPLLPCPRIHPCCCMSTDAHFFATDSRHQWRQNTRVVVLNCWSVLTVPLTNSWSTEPAQTWLKRLQLKRLQQKWYWTQRCPQVGEIISSWKCLVSLLIYSDGNVLLPAYT